MNDARAQPATAEAGGEPALTYTAGLALLAVLTLFWGLNWPAMKVVLAEVPVATFRALCVLFGGGGLMAIAWLGGHSLRLPRAQWRPMVLSALLNITGWQSLIAIGLTLIDAGRTVVIAYTMPLWAVLFARFGLGDRLTPARIGGLALGLAGMALLLGPDAVALGRAPGGALAVLAGAACWGAGTVVVKAHRWSIGTTAFSGWQLLIGGLPIVLAAFVLDPWTDVTALREDTLLAGAFSLVIPMIVCHYIWYRLVRGLPAAVAAISTLGIPVVGVWSSALLLDEAVGWREVGALLLVLAGLFFVLVLPGLQAARR